MSSVAFVTSPARSVAASIAPAEVEESISRATRALLDRQKPDGHFAFDLEADATIPAEYILLKHFLDDIDPVTEAAIARYLRRIQGPHGGWPLLHGGAFNISASVKAYLALKLIGDSPEADHMVKARAAILAAGGAAHSNIFTRTSLALFGMVPWRAVPVMPVEIMHLPRWFPFHIYRISYWARVTMVPLTILAALKPRARNPRRVDIPELFVVPPEQVRSWPKGSNQIGPWGAIFGAIDHGLRFAEPFFPKASRRSAIDKALSFVEARLNGEDGLGAIYPAIANTVMVYDTLGYPPDLPQYVTARKAIEKLMTREGDEAYCQPCLSPVWDTALSAHALLEAGEDQAARVDQALGWLAPLQVLDVKGDWAEQKPEVQPGGWAFQYANPHYPDLDDTAVVVMAMDRAQTKAGHRRFDAAIARAREWVVGLQSRGGGWAAFDADNTATYLNYIPFADHGALLDPPTADVTARCVSMLAQLGETPETSAPMRRGIDYLLREQRPEGSWYGRWGLNYVYGTWSVLCALNAAGLGADHPAVRKAVAWLESIQNPDGGWGEDDRSYAQDYAGHRVSPSTASQTSWALLGLMAAGAVDSPAVTRGVAHLRRAQGEDGFWAEEDYTATGFPRVFYLRYHGYPKFFPLWALSRWRNLKSGNTTQVSFGM